MASVGSLTSSTSNSIRGYGGLASGLDRDELIKGMTIGTTSKLNQQEQKKQKIEWMQEAVRTISDKMISFHGKYTETLTSSSNLFSSMLWGRNKITTTGANSKYVAVSGTATGADAMTIMGVKQKAQNASISTKGMASDRALSSAEIDATATYATLADKNLVFSVNDKDYVITLDEASLKKDKDGNVTAVSVAEAINEKLKTAKNGDGVENISGHFKVTVSGNGFKISATGTDAERAENKTKLRGGTALEFMGIENKEVDFSDKEDIVSDVVSTKPIKLTKSFEEMVKGQTLTFSYNGTSQQIAIENAADLDQVKNSLQKSLDAKFGEGRIDVAVEDGKLTFKTTVPGGGGEDTSSTLKLTGGSADAIKALGLSVGSSNRVSMDAKLSDFGFKEEAITPTEDEDGNPVQQQGYKIQINGTTIEMNKNATVKDLMNAINNSGANVNVSYQEAADKFTFTSTVDGASGVIHFQGNGDGSKGTNLAALNKLFGIDVKENDPEVRGKDAIVAVKYAGAEEPVELRRGTNSFTVDGLTINVKGEFGYKTVKDKDGNDVKELDPATEAIEVDASVDVDRLMSTIKSFVEDYNAIVDLVNGELTTKHDRDYDPLTSDQKDELSESEITKWETKAKEGLLYGDSDLRSLSMDLRVVVSDGNLMKLQDIGISISSTYSDNGKLSIDETKLRAALETNPESVEKLFTNPESRDEYGNDVTGLATNLKKVMEKYVKTTGPMEEKGILIRKAGSKSAAMSLTQNTYYDQLTSIDKLIATLQARLKTEQDRYISQFSTLETMIANMNSQASYLSSM